MIIKGTAMTRIVANFGPETKAIVIAVMSVVKAETQWPILIPLA